MENIFLRLLNLSISAGWLVLAIIAFRFLIKKAPKWIVCLLWAMVAIRLVCPISIESIFSLVPSAETVPQEIIYAKDPQIHTGIDSLNSTINPIINETLAPEPLTSANPAQILCIVAWNVWIVGMIAMILYAIISYIRIRFKVRASIKKEKGVYATDNIDTPFILGVISPKIYLPSSMNEEDIEHVIAHEKAHLSRLDHLWKPLGYLLLSIYWFNPLMWLAYILLCRDIELACDEKVIGKMEAEGKKAYSTALLSCSVRGKLIAACPLAFGEVGVKARIKSVLSYKKPAFWIIIICLILSVALAVCFLTDPPAEADIPDTVEIIESGSDLEGLSIEIKEMELEGTQPYITIVWKNNTEKSFTYGDPFQILKKENDQWKNCRADEAYWNAIGYMLSPMAKTEKTYNLYYIDFSKEGYYRFEVDCFENGKSADIKYKLWVDFTISEGHPFTSVKQYKAKELVFDSAIYSYLITPENAPYWKISSISSSELFLWEKIQSDVDWNGIAEMSEIKLTKESFDKRLDVAPIWTEGYSLEKLKKENKKAWEITNSEDNGQIDLFMLLEQKNGDSYLCIGYRGDDGENDKFRWIFKLETMDVGSEENTASRPALIYNGKYYVDLSEGATSLPEGFTFKGFISPHMANNTSLEGCKYFTNEDEDYCFYVAYTVDGKTIYKMWESGRPY